MLRRSSEHDHPGRLAQWQCALSRRQVSTAQRSVPKRTLRSRPTCTVSRRHRLDAPPACRPDYHGLDRQSRDGSRRRPPTTGTTVVVPTASRRRCRSVCHHYHPRRHTVCRQTPSSASLTRRCTVTSSLEYRTRSGSCLTHRCEQRQ